MNSSVLPESIRSRDSYGFLRFLEPLIMKMLFYEIRMSVFMLYGWMDARDVSVRRVEQILFILGISEYIHSPQVSVW